MTALIAGSVADRIGRKRTALFDTFLFAIGSYTASISHNATTMAIGRFISGLGAGFAIVITPIYLNEISPNLLRGLFGTMNQASICAGILLTQMIGLYYSDETHWRFIIRTGAYIGITNAILLYICLESPKWLAVRGQVSEATRTLVKLRGSVEVEDELSLWLQTRPSGESDGLLGQREPPTSLPSSPDNSNHDKDVKTRDFLTLPEYRPALIAVVGVMSFQQLSGINAIIFYGVYILSASMPQYSKLINCFISFLNLVVTLGISPFVDRFGRRPLLLISLAGMSLCSALLGISTLGQFPIGSSLSAALFVASFGIGLGPIPFLIISELVPTPAIGVAQSTATTANWIATFLIVFIFPYLDLTLGHYTFFVFSLTGALGVLFIYRCIPETKHRATYREVWAGFHYPRVSN